MNKLTVIKYGTHTGAESYLRAIQKRLGKKNIKVIDVEGMTETQILNLDIDIYKDNYLVLDPCPQDIKEILDDDMEHKEKYPITPTAIYNEICRNTNVVGKNVVIVNRTERIGKPLAEMLIDAGATVTVCNSHTTDLESFTDHADILITATGKPNSVYPNGVDMIFDVSGDIMDAEAVARLLGDEYYSPSRIGQLTLDELERRLKL